MKHLSTLLLAALFAAFSLQSTAQIKKGYHGFVDVGYSLGLESTLSHNWAEVNTIHGYEINSHFFIGAGVGLHFMPTVEKDVVSGRPMWKRDSSVEIPLFLNLKWNILNKKVTPIIDIRAGQYLTNSSGLYASLGVGCRAALKKQQAFYALLSFSEAKLRYSQLEMSSGYYGSHYHGPTYYYKDKDEARDAVTIKIGYEF